MMRIERIYVLKMGRIAGDSIFFFILNICVLGVYGQSLYTVEVDIPEYDSLNNQHFLISSKTDWTHINDDNKRFFYVEPHADYGTRIITADGTENEKRYLSLYNGNDMHPAKLDWEQQTNVGLVFNGAQWWVVDRMSSILSDQDYCCILKNRSQNIVLNRLYLTGFNAGIRIQGPSTSPFTENITIQNSRFDEMSQAGIEGDHVAILLIGDIWNGNVTILNTKILNNEIRNCNDGIQPIRFPDQGHEANYPGTIIDFNHIYVDYEMYTDGNGNFHPDGLWALTENAVDLKAGSNDPGNPMIISNNYFWGYRRTDKNAGGSGSWGAALIGHYHVKNIVIHNNVIFNSNRSITFDDPQGLPYSVENAYIYGNILYDNGYSTVGGTEYSNLFYDSKNVVFEKNTIVSKDKQSRWFSLNNSEMDMNVSCNLIIDSYEMTGTRTPSTAVENNAFFNTLLQNSRDGLYFNSASDAAMEDLTFTTDRYTNDPREITLPGVKTTKATPIADGCFATSTEGAEAEVPASIALLEQNYPNPFNAHTTIPYNLPESGHIIISVYSIDGKIVAELVNGFKQAGRNKVVFHKKRLTCGVYYYRIRSESFSEIKRMSIISI